VKSPRSKPTPNWKQVVLASPDWPNVLVVPQNDSLPEESEAIQDSMSTKESWEWELWRHPEGHCYYLKVWPMDEADYENASTPGAALTVMETFQLLLTNWMPRDVIADLTFEHPDLVKPFELPGRTRAELTRSYEDDSAATARPTHPAKPPALMANDG
jgi:hypothetical protein